MRGEEFHSLGDRAAPAEADVDRAGRRLGRDQLDAIPGLMDAEPNAASDHYHAYDRAAVNSVVVQHAHAEEAISILRTGLAQEPDTPNAYEQLAMAYGRKGDLAQADLASAQAAFYRGDIKTARELAARAKTRFPVGTPGWVKADDIVSTKLPESAQMRRR